MGARITGVAIIRVDGQEFPTERGATLDPGGVNRETKMAGRRPYYTEEPVPPKIEGDVLHTEDIDLIELGKIRDATVLFECDNGQDYMLGHAFVTETPQLSSGEGTVRLRMAARTCERI